MPSDGPDEQLSDYDFDPEKLTLRLQVSLAADKRAIDAVVQQVMDTIRQSKCADGKEDAIELALTEALANAARHAHATRIRIEIDQDQDGLRCLIGDDGAGFEVDSCVRRGGLGLRGMRERLSALGGSLHIVSAPGHGAEIRFQLPVGSS